MAKTNIQAFSGEVEVASNLQVGTANLFVDITTGKVGIGKTNPTQLLDIVGNVAANVNTLFVDTVTSRVGIGTSNPSTNFDVNGNVNIGSTLTVSGFRITAAAAAEDDLQAITNAGADTDNQIHITNATRAISSSTGALRVGDTGAPGGIGVVGNVYVGDTVTTQDLSVNNVISDFAVNTNDLFVDISESKVGILTTQPHAELHVVGNVYASSNLTVDTDTFHVDAENDRVGVNTKNPEASLHLVGNAFVSSNLEVGTADLFVDTVNSRVGIGVTNPNVLLELSSDTGSATIVPTELRLSTLTDAGDWVTTSPWGKISFYSADVSNGGPQVRGAIGMSAIETFGGYGRLGLFTEIDGTLSERMSIKHDGKVGIGVTDPSSIFNTYGGPLWDGSDHTSKVCATLQVGRGSGSGASTQDFGTGAILEFRHSSDSRFVTIESVSEGLFSAEIGLVFKTKDSGDPQERMRIDAHGNVGIGTVTPEAFFHVLRDSSLLGEDADQDTHLKVEGAGTMTLERKSGGTLVSKLYSNMSSSRPKWVYYYNSSSYWQVGQAAENVTGTDANDYKFFYGTTMKAWLDASDGTVEINFTGQHRTFIDGVPTSKSGDFVGLVVSANKNKYMKMSKGVEMGSNAITINESLPLVSLSTVAHDKACFGVISDAEDSETRKDSFGSFVVVSNKEKGDTRVYINSVGEGAIWVVNTNGSLESGDYITTSNVAGYGQKQDSEFLANYTVAKITMDCDFDPVTQPIQIIKKELANVNYWVKTTYENVSKKEYSNLEDENRRTITETLYTNEDGETFTEQNEQSTYTELEQTTYQKITKEESKTEQEGWELEVRQELVNVLDEHGQIQWEDDPSGATEKAYKIRYLDANGNITDEANAVHKAAFVGCTYHCG